MSRLTVAIVLLLLTAGVVFFIIAPQWQQISATRAEIQRLQDLNAELAELDALRESLTQQYNAISEADMDKLEAIAPPTPDTARALVDFEALALKNGVVLDRVDFISSEKASGGGLQAPSARSYVPLPVTINLKGSYDAFRSFLSGLEQNVRLFDVSEINLGGGEKDITHFSATLSGKIYFRK
jgi:Tfp pilus assembly protein PilO